MKLKDIEDAAIAIIAGLGSLATFVYLTFFEGPHPSGFWGWLWEIGNNGGAAMFWPLYWPARLIGLDFGF